MKRFLLTAAVAFASLAGAAEAATIKVEPMLVPIENDGLCSLREAMISANKNVSRDACEKGESARDTIKLPGNDLSQPYVLDDSASGEDDSAEGDLDYTGGGPLTILGRGADKSEISGILVDDRLLHATKNATSLTVAKLALLNGTAPDGDGSQGGNLLVDAGALKLNRVLVEGGSAEVGGGVRFNGVLSAKGITVTRSRFENNEAEEAGALSTLAPDKPTVVRRSVFALNIATGGNADGGAVIAEGDRVTISDSLFSENTAHADAASGGTALGGAMLLPGEGSDGYRVERSTFEGNVASQAGSSNALGGAIAALGDATIVNSTLWDNESEGSGGAIYGEGTVAHSTLLANSAAEEGDQLAGRSGLLSSPLFVRNSILPGAQIAVDVCAEAGTVVSEGFNVFSYDDLHCGTLDSDVTNGGNAGLDPSPSDNGGLTPTIAISAESVAKDLVPVGRCKLADGEDQRGRERPRGPRCDAGAFEKGAKP